MLVDSIPFEAVERQLDMAGSCVGTKGSLLWPRHKRREGSRWVTFLGGHVFKTGGYLSKPSLSSIVPSKAFRLAEAFVIQRIVCDITFMEDGETCVIRKTWSRILRTNSLPR